MQMGHIWLLFGSHANFLVPVMIADHGVCPASAGVVNAIQGQFTSYGLDRQLPEKFKNSVGLRIQAAQKALKREKARDLEYGS
jgi:hypothetical protein